MLVYKHFIPNMCFITLVGSTILKKKLQFLKKDIFNI